MVPGIWLSEAGACMPAALPLGKYCKMVIQLKHKHVQTVLNAALAGHNEIGPECHAWGKPV